MLRHEGRRWGRLGGLRDRCPAYATHVPDCFYIFGCLSVGLLAVRQDIERLNPSVVPAFDLEVFRARFWLLRCTECVDDV